MRQTSTALTILSPVLLLAAMQARAATPAQSAGQWKTIISTYGFAVDVPAVSSYVFAETWRGIDFSPETDDSDYESNRTRQFIDMTPTAQENIRTPGYIEVHVHMPPEFSAADVKALKKDSLIRTKRGLGVVQKNPSYTKVSFTSENNVFSVEFALDYDLTMQGVKKEEMQWLDKQKWRTIQSFRWLKEKK